MRLLRRLVSVWLLVQGTPATDFSAEAVDVLTLDGWAGMAAPARHHEQVHKLALTLSTPGAAAGEKQRWSADRWVEMARESCGRKF